MGLFDKLLKEGTEKLKEVTKEVTSEENKEKASAFLNTLRETVSDGAEQLKEVAKEVASEENKEKATAYLNSFKDAVNEGAEAIKEAAREASTEENKAKASAFFGSLKDTLEKQAGDLKKYAEENKTETYHDDTVYEEPEDGLTCRERILEILASEFPEYTVRENVSPQEFNGVGRFMDYSIVVYKDGTPKLIMMLIGKTTTSHREYRWSREEAEKHGYPFINFVKHYPNTPDYISRRLHQYL